jgi:CheY-like chemotaxis protein
MYSQGNPILVVDDDPILRDAVVLALSLAGYPVREAGNGSEALALVEAVCPSLILLDMHMPVLDGWGFSRGLKAMDLSPPVLMLTAGSDPARLAKEVAASDFLAKPFALPDLLAKVAELRPPTQVS